ncbi:unnamed protein product, partial [Cladocopium goreaui]
VLKKLLALRLQLNLIHKNVAINACLRSRSWQLAVHHLGSISLQSMQPNEVTYNTIISTCLEWKLAFYLLRHLQNALISPSTTTYNAMTSAVSWQLSCKLLSEMKFRMLRHDVQTGSPGSAGSGSPGSWDCELGRVYQMRRCNLKPDVVNYGMLLGRCDAQTWRTGNSILCHMSEWLVRPNEIIFGSFVNMIGTTMDWRASVVNLDRMALLCLARDELSFHAGARACQLASRWVHAIGILSQDKDAVDTNKGYCNLIEAHRSNGNWKACLSSFQSAIWASLEVDLHLLSVSTSACEKATQWLGASQLLEVCHALSAANVQSDGVIHNAVLSAARSSWRMALAAATAAEQLQLSVDAAADCISFNSAISVCADSQEWQVAMQHFQSMTDVRLDQDAFSFNSLTKSLEKTGKWELALILLVIMTNEKRLVPDEYSYNAAINACKFAVRLAAQFTGPKRCVHAARNRTGGMRKHLLTDFD